MRAKSCLTSTNESGEHLISLIVYQFLFQVYLGADGAPPTVPPVDSGENAWRRKFRVVELVIHYKYKMVKNRGRRTTIRTDYDIALLRIDYPAVDKGNGNNR